MSVDLAHTCSAYDKVTDGVREYAYGKALDKVIYYDAEQKVWFATNTEYGIAVAYCPWCGIELRKLVT